tara:strand:- start:513 stop:1826 length:1314 start_codon:yes stop_codon:yes gene_type:complete
MIIFDPKDIKETFLIRQINYLLGIKFLDEVHFIFDPSKDSQKKFLDKEKKFIIVSDSEVIRDFDNVIFIKSEIKSMIYDYFTLRSEESMKRDNLNRSVFSREDLMRLKEPVIDKEILRIRQEICETLEQRKIKHKLARWPNKPIVCLTHDVDSLKAKSFLRGLFWILNGIKNNKLKEAITKSKRLFQMTYDEHGDFEKFIEIEKKYGFKSTYFFMSLPFFLGNEGRRYRIRKHSIKKAIQNLIDNGFEVGLHTSRKGSEKPNILNNEIIRLNSLLGRSSQIKGARNHYLAGSFQDIWKKYESHGLLYDATLGWHDFNGYRSGTSMPFIPFNLSDCREFNLYELPQIVMDGAIKDGSSLDIFNEAKFFVDKAKKYNSVLTISWHTNRIIGEEFKEYSKAYNLLLEYLNQQEFVSYSAHEIIEYAKEYHKEMDDNLFII